ncbi:MAG TPA: hypothetical protein VLX09_10640 [Stellaceae bacterium]|nr:hypothetical protein [Stellaceae bacterium]
MSFDIYIGAFEKNGQPRPISRALIERAFGSFADMSDPTRWKVADSAAVIQLDDVAPDVVNFAVNRPPGGDHPFWPALLNLLRETSSTLYWPGAPGPIVTDQSVGENLPPRMIKGLGPAQVVTSIEDIFRLISES